jgi:hypothetical protein
MFAGVLAWFFEGITALPERPGMAKPNGD